MRKRLACIAIILALVVSLLPLSALATSEEGQDRVFYITSVTEEGGEMLIRLSSTLPGQFSMETVDVLLNDVPMITTSVTPLLSDERPTNYLFLLDYARTVTANQRGDMTAFLDAFAAHLPAASRFAARTVDGAYNLPLGSSVETMDTWLKTLKTTQQDVSLYSAVSSAATALQAMAAPGARLCLIVLTDGQEDVLGGLSQPELIDQLQASGITVHSVAMTTRSSDVTQVSNVGAWARVTGGQALQIAANRDKNDAALSPAGMADACWQQESIVDIACHLPVDTQPFSTPGALVLRLQYAGSYVTNTTPYPVSAALLNSLTIEAPVLTEAPSLPPTIPPTEPPAESTAIPADVVEAEPDTPPETSLATTAVFTVTEEPAPQESESTPQPDESSSALDRVLALMVQPWLLGLPVWAFIAAGAGLVLLIVLLCLLIGHSRKKKRAPRSEQSALPPDIDPDDSLVDPGSILDGVSLISSTTGLSTDGGAHDGHTEIPGLQLNMPLRKHFRLILTRRSPHPEQFTFVSDQPVTLGRSSSKANWVIDSDKGLSGAHCRLTLRDDRLFITDLNSTNGTYIGGKRISAETEVQQDQDVTLGVTVYHINWMDA